jgi:hypothetical protein
MSVPTGWSSGNLTPQNVELVRQYHALKVPFTRISKLTGLSLYYVKQIVNGIEVPVNGLPRPSIPHKQPDIITLRYVPSNKVNAQ